jgi:hypothetical protein
MIPAAMTSIDNSSEGWQFKKTTAKAHLNEAICGAATGPAWAVLTGPMGMELV